ncbi:MAG: tetratricopeptide repeat protein [Smithella sp.]|jgi:tetratricopeptide (TPR) repeat protein
MTEKKKIKIDLAEKLCREKKYREAIVLCEEIHKDYPEEESALLMLSWAYYDSGEIEQAEKYLHILLNRELKRRVFTGFAFDELVRIYKQKKNFQKLTEICERAAAAQPEDVGLLTELGNSYLKSGKPEKACAVYEKLIKIENDNPVFYCYWGEALFAAGLNKESEDAYLKAGEIDSEQPDRYFFKIAVLFQQSQNHKEAERLLNKCIAADSSHPLYYCSLGDSFIGLGQIQEALKAYEKAVQCDHSRAGAYYNRLGHSLMKAGNFSEAAKAFQSAVKVEPVRHYYLSLASAYKEMGLNEQAGLIIRELDKTK